MGKEVISRRGGNLTPILLPMKSLKEINGNILTSQFLKHDFSIH
jgi:hypothetical protein